MRLIGLYIINSKDLYMQVGQMNNTTIKQQLMANNRDQSLSTQIINSNNMNNNTNNTLNRAISSQQLQTHKSSQQASFHQQLETHISKCYSLSEFIQIMLSLKEQDVLYQCQQQQLQLIYEKTVQHQHKFTGQSIREFAQVLKQKNKQKFIQQISFYKQYIRLNQQMNNTQIQSKQLLNSVYLNEQVGYLTSAVYQITKQSPSQYILIDKLQQLINRVQKQFKQHERVSIPRRVLVKKTIYLQQEGENQQQLQQQVVFELIQSQSNSAYINNIQHIDLQSLRVIVEQTLQYIDNTQVSSKVQREFNKLQQSINTINSQTIPLFKEQLTTIKSYNSKLQQQLTTLYQQLQNKHSQLIDNKNILLELTDQNRLINKQLINTKIQLNSKDQYIYQLQTELIKANNQSLQYKNKTQQFFNQYTNLKSEYQNFIQLIKQQHERKTKLQQTNLLPTISLKQQLEDAQFKIRKLKSDKEQLLKDMQLNQNIFAAKLITLQKQLQQARLNANRTEQLKLTGVSRLSKNYEAFKNSKSMIRRSINPSLVSVFIQSNKLNNTKKMSCYVQQVDDYMMGQSYIKRDKLLKQQSQLTNSNNNKFVNSNLYRESIVQKVNINSKSSNNTNNNSIKTVNNKQEINKQKVYQQQFLFQDQQWLQQQFNRQSKQQQPRFNFTQIDYQQLQVKWKGQHPDVLHDDQIQPFSQSEQHTLDAQQIVNPNIEDNHINNNNNNNINSNNSNNVQNDVVNLQELKQTYMRDKPQTVFITPADIISKSGIKYKKHLFFNRKGIFMFDTKLRLQKIIKYTKINAITFTYYNLDTFVISFKKKQISPMMKKKSTTNQGDVVFKCLKTKQLLSFLSQPIFNKFILKQSLVKVTIQKQSNIWIHDSNDKDMLLLNCTSFYNPFRLNLSLKNQHNKMFYAQLSRQNYFSRSHIIICIVEQFGVYCFEWNEDQLQKEKKFIYLLPLVKRMIFIRQQQSDTVKVVYEDWSDGKTFLLKFKNYKQSLRFQTICRHQLKANLNVLEDRKKAIENVFQFKQNQNN